MVDQDSPHRLGRRREEMSPIRECTTVCQTQIGFVNQGRRIERVRGVLLAHANRGKTAQFVVNERQ